MVEKTDAIIDAIANEILDAAYVRAKQLVLKSFLEDYTAPINEKGEIKGWTYRIEESLNFSCRISSKSGNEFIAMLSSYNEAKNTLIQLGNFHPDGEWLLGKPTLGFTPIDLSSMT